jgi:hypothetical protein
MLVRGFVRRSLGLQLQVAELKPFRERWKGKVQAKALPWYAEEKAACGAFAALLGLEFLHESSGIGHMGYWQATAAGDCCLVQVRRNEIVTTFPYDDSVAFTTRPDLLSSLPSLNGQATEIVKTSQGSCGFEDTFFLMTDALACWFFKQLETGKEPWNVLRDLDTEGQVSFPKLIEQERLSASMRNDDVTLAQIDIA